MERKTFKSVEELYEHLNYLWSVMQKDHNKGVGKNVRAAKHRARMIALELSKLMIEYRKMTREEKELPQKEDV